MINVNDRIYVDTDIHQPMIVGTTITVESIMALVSQGLKAKQIRREPGMRALLERDVEAAITFARDSWATPKHVAEVLPRRERLIDPCSNPRSFVDAIVRFMLELGEDGLALPWRPRAWNAPDDVLLTYVNAGFSDLWPWVEKLRTERERIAGAAFMVNVDNSTRWWQGLTETCSCVFFFDRRLPFVPFPGVAKSTNNKPQALIGDRAFFEECKPGLFSLGEMYQKSEPFWARRAA